MPAKKDAEALAGAGSRLKRRNYGRGHSYTIDGVKCEGVTTLLGDGMRKKALEAWSANETAAYAVDHWEELSGMTPSARLEKLKKARYEVRDEAARKGTLVHDLAEKIAHGAEVEVPDDIRGHVENAVSFLNDYQAEVLMSEVMVFSVAGRYAGTFDMLLTSPLFPGRVVLADWKTSRSGIYGETALQLEAYHKADFYVDENGVDQPMESLGITDHWGIWIPDVSKSKYQVYPMASGPEVFKTFQVCATNARRTSGPKGSAGDLSTLKGEPLTAPRRAA